MLNNRVYEIADRMDELNKEMVELHIQLMADAWNMDLVDAKKRITSAHQEWTMLLAELDSKKW